MPSSLNSLITGVVNYSVLIVRTLMLEKCVLINAFSERTGGVVKTGVSPQVLLPCISFVDNGVKRQTKTVQVVLFIVRMTSEWRPPFQVAALLEG